MSEQKAPEFKAPLLLIFICGLVLFLAWYALQEHIGTKFLIPYFVGFCISVGGIFYISIKIYLTEKKPFTDCNKITPKDLSWMMVFISIIGLSMSFRTPNPVETAILTKVEIQFLILIANISISIGAIHLIVANKTTRETIIVLGSSVIYFWTGFYVYNMGLNNLLFSLLNSTALITLGLGIYMLSQQRDEKDILQEQVEKLQKTRKTARDLQTKLSESEFAKTISHLSDVPLTEAPPVKVAWDIDYDIRKIKENQYIAKQLKHQLEALEKLKTQEPSETDKNLLTFIEQAKKHLESLKQQINQIEKAKTTLQRSGHYSSNESVGQFQQNAPITVDKIHTILLQMQTTIQQHKEKLQTQNKQEFEQAVSNLKSDINRLGGLK